MQLPQGLRILGPVLISGYCLCGVGSRFPPISEEIPIGGLVTFSCPVYCMCMHEAVGWCRGLIPPDSQCSWDRLWIHLTRIELFLKVKEWISKWFAKQWGESRGFIRLLCYLGESSWIKVQVYMVLLAFVKKKKTTLLNLSANWGKKGKYPKSNNLYLSILPYLRLVEYFNVLLPEM